MEEKAVAYSAAAARNEELEQELMVRCSWWETTSVYNDINEDQSLNESVIIPCG